jgi:hypothetical protein
MNETKKMVHGGAPAHRMKAGKKIHPRVSKRLERKQKLGGLLSLNTVQGCFM